MPAYSIRRRAYLPAHLPVELAASSQIGLLASGSRSVKPTGHRSVEPTGRLNNCTGLHASNKAMPKRPKRPQTHGLTGRGARNGCDAVLVC